MDDEFTLPCDVECPDCGNYIQRRIDITEIVKVEVEKERDNVIKEIIEIINNHSKRESERALGGYQEKAKKTGEHISIWIKGFGEDIIQKMTALQSPTTEKDTSSPEQKTGQDGKQDHPHAGLSPGRMDSTTHKKYKISDCIQVDESAKEDFKRVMNWTEEEWLARVENGAKTFIHPQEYRDKEHVKCGGASTK